MRLDLAIREGTERLQKNVRGDARLDAETLMMHVLGRDKAYLYAHPELELSCTELNRYDEALQRRCAGEPLQYITGHQEFWGIDLLVTPAVLIPRPETEHAVEAALERLRGMKSPRVIDVGTGSGCIAVALASELPEARIEAVDISDEALNVARSNAARLDFANRIEFSKSDLLGKYLDGSPTFDMVVSNPPYVGESEADKLQVEVREHEPHQALFGGGKEGLDIYRRLIPQAAQVLKPGGWLVMEIGYTQEQAIRNLLKEWDEVRAVPDLQGIPRVVIGQRAKELRYRKQ
ncbi:MAG TPA: peptide chain release factor N(5)-glutamine methyltransferase [Terriglobales bacterium]|nr:peptide chain release factor N(5)-glutamine methyltransferase [Terriglobales bacterium]